MNRVGAIALATTLLLAARSPSAAVGACDAAQYNDAIGLLRAGQAEAGILRLDALGRCPADDALARAVRDRANLMLGDFYLQHGEGRTAIALLGRVRSSGPHSSAALLSLGWAQLLPAGANDGELVPVPGGPDVPLQKFLLAGPGADPGRAQALRRALVPWGELLGRNPFEPAVQQGLLAVAYAVLHLGDAQQAQDRYRRAIVTLIRVRDHLRAARGRVAGGALRAVVADGLLRDDWPTRLERLAPRRWWRGELGEVPEDFYVETLLADERFQAELGGPPERLEVLASTRLRELESQTHRALAEAYFALARMHDLALAEVAAR